MKLKSFDISTLKNHPKNYNVHPPAQIIELMDSLEEFGQAKNIVVWNGFIIAGEGLITAARQLNLKKIDAFDASDWNEEKALRFMVADNETAKGSVADMVMLQSLLFNDEGESPETPVPGVSDEMIEQMIRASFQDDEESDEPTSPPARFVLLVEFESEMDLTKGEARLKELGFDARPA